MEQKTLVRPIELTLLTPAGDAHQVLMKQSPFVIGRHESCDMVLNSRSVSRLHCQLKLKSFGLTVKDLESRNGTYLNNEKIVPKERVLLQEGVILRIGKFRLRIDRIHREVEISEMGGLLLETAHETSQPAQSAKYKSPPIAAERSDSGAGDPVDEPDQLLAQLEQFISHAHKNRRRPLELTPSARPENSAETTVGKDRVDTKDAATSEADTVMGKPNETTASTPASHSHTLYESEDTESDESELHRLRLREQLDALKPRDSKEAAIQALKNLFGHR